MKVVDLFAGPGGWDLAAHELGLDVLGVEFDDAACATREAAGLDTLQADVSALDPKDFPCEGLIASPPCQAFSMAGKGEGRKAIDLYCELIDRYTGSVTDEDLAPIKEACSDDRAHLVLEPLRWAFALDPEWIACEQVEPVLPIWEAMGRTLRRRGYSVWVGVLSAEQYGVPQTRRRAFLIASKSCEVLMPTPTHQRYIAPRSKMHDKQTDSLFDAGDRTRIVHPDDRGLLPWVSMAEALGWGQILQAVDTRGNSGRENDSFDADAMPSRTITGKSDSWVYRASKQQNAAVRPATAPAPAPTIAFGHDVASAGWELDSAYEWAVARRTAKGYIRVDDHAPSPTVKPISPNGGAPRFDDLVHLPMLADEQFVSNENARLRWSCGRSSWVHNRPSPTVVTTRRSKDGALIGRQLPEGEGENIGGKNWVNGRPATTVVGSYCPDVISPPGYRKAGDGPRQNQEGAVRVTQQEAAVLQSFPAEYPWQGSKTKQFQQIGNAVPPLLALAVLGALVPAVASEREAA